MIMLSHVQQIRILKEEQKYVSDYARLTAMRVDLTLDNAKQALVRVEAERNADCSPEHIRRMGQIVLDAHSIQDIGFFRNGHLVCTSLGGLSTPIPQRRPDMDLGQGYSLVFAVEPKLFRSKPLVELRRGNYGVLIRSGRLIDVVTDTGMTLGVATNQGHVLELSGTAEPQLIRALLARQNAGIGDRYVFASHRAAGLAAFAIVDREPAQTMSGSDWREMLPLSLVISTALIGIVIWVSRQQLSPEKTLELAIQKREFVVHYQPIVELSTGRCVAAEALLRWPQRKGEMMNPDTFIPLAEATGLISRLTDLVIEIVMKEMGSLLRNDRHFHISINIPAGDMESGRFLPGLAAVVRKEGVDPSQVWLEVTEGGFINADAAINAIKAARAAGYQITIDDFGTGYSSLSLLEGLPLDALKIDKSFIDAIGRDAAKSVVAPHIIAMAHDLKLCMIAEGIETSEQEAYVKEANVQLGQGWLFSKALPSEQFRAFYNRNRAAAQLQPDFT
ncbi:EAL domain-containing protein [Mesorhizobium sp. KR1-2]|uniref:EAL domain-containing protein n=1 Tax=Mesorhizobium sp. KR1-2 TaxID=3156609 RepID=UPI0032B61ED2